MLKRFIVEVPYNFALSRVYYYKGNDVCYKYLNDCREYLVPIHSIGKTLEELLQLVPLNLRTITGEDEIDKILMMTELVDA